MAAQVFGSIIPGGGLAQSIAVLADGRLVAVRQFLDTPELQAQFYAPDGTALGGPVVLNPGGIPDFGIGAGVSTSPSVEPLAGGGFAVVAQRNNGGAQDYLGTFDRQGVAVNVFSPADTAPNQGGATFLVLNDGGFYVGDGTSANAGTGFNPLLQGYTALGNSDVEGTDLIGNVANSGGTITATYTYDSGTYLAEGYGYQGLAGDQLDTGAVQLTGGAIVQAYIDEQYYAFYAGDSNQVTSSQAAVFSLNGGARTVVFAPPDNNGPTGPGLDPHAGVHAVALADGRLLMLYDTVDNTDPSMRVHTTYAAFYTASGQTDGAATAIDTRIQYNSGNGNFPGDPYAAAALPSGGFAIAYYDQAADQSFAFKVTLYDAGGNPYQTIDLPDTGHASPGLLAAADGSLYVTDGNTNNVIHIVGTAPGDFVLDHSGDVGPDVMLGTSSTANWLYAGAGDTTATGGPGVNHIFGGTGTDTLIGGPGNDQFSAGAGNGSIDGGTGINSVFFDGNEADFNVVVTAPDTATVTTLATGAVDTLTNIQTLDFADGQQSIACFAAGTRILTRTGPVAVERLAPGDLVVTTSGIRPVRWIGQRHVDCRRHPRPHDVLPVRVQAHAFAADAPLRDLYLSPDHAVHFADGTGCGTLIPVRYLLNGASIAQVDVEEVHYFHVELDAHAVLMAQGLACESYLNTGNRHDLGGIQERPGLCPGPTKGLRPLETHL